MIGVKKIENSEAGQMGPWWGSVRVQKKGGRAAYTQGMYFYTHLYTLDIVHVKIYAIHTRLLPGAPQAAVALVGMGEQRAFVKYTL